MSLHKARVYWKRTTPDFAYDTYDRTHDVVFEGGNEMKMSAAPDFKGNGTLVNPEEQLAAALSSCHMLTFLAIAARSRLVVDRYEDDAVAELAKGPEGKLCITKVTLHPKVTFAAPEPTAEKLAHLHQKAHENCFIALSVKCEVAIAPAT